ncbi:MAG: response regulator [Lachnospiraceae bacterium]|nr:response regulator [Lachnospiraceae bacterium]
MLITSMLFCSISVYRARIGIRKAIQQRMLDIANCASGSLDGDALGALTKDDVGSDVYNDLYRRLAVFRDNVELEYIYSIREEADGQFVFTMDLDQETPAAYGDSVEYTEALARAGDGISAVDEEPYTDKWGEFYSAYSPVFDSKGNVAGIIAVDFSADWFDGQLTSQMRSTVVSYLIILLISLLVAAALSLSTVRPFMKMQTELFEEKVRAESANIAKSDFLANMSHEIRTPINAMLGMNEMIMRESRASKGLENIDAKTAKESMNNILGYAGDVQNAGHNLLALVNDILDFSKIEAGRIDLSEAPYSLGNLLGEIGNMIRIKAKDKDLEYIEDIDRSLPDKLCGDAVRVRQVLTNLLNNAVKYTEKGCVSLKVTGRRQDTGTVLLSFVVSDTGIGIKAEDRDRLFGKFERLEMERNSTLQGTGLGLVITKRLLDMMDGTVSVESEYGRGSIFTVTISQKVVEDTAIAELEPEKESAPEIQSSSDTAEETKQDISGGLFRAPTARVLIVDDTMVNIMVVMHLLKHTQVIFDKATSGADAIQMAEKTMYDLILMDQRMPEMDGTEAFHRIRATQGGASSDSPVVCLTADAVVGARERYLAEGFTDYMAKPVEGYALEKMLMRYLPKEKVETA